MMWVLFVLSLIELVVVHIFVALKWPVIGWTLTILSALGAIWLAWWIVSMKGLPHELREDELVLRFGTLKTVEVSLGNVSAITSAFEPGALEKEGNINLAGIAHPNRCLELKEPVEKNKSRVFIRLDDPAAFDTEMRNRGFDIR